MEILGEEQEEREEGKEGRVSSPSSCNGSHGEKDEEQAEGEEVVVDFQECSRRLQETPVKYGIAREDRLHRLAFDRLIDSMADPVSSNIDCMQWWVYRTNR